MNVVDAIRMETKGLLTKVALIDGTRQVTFAQLFETNDRISEELRSLGLKASDRIALLCQDSIEYVAVSLAVLSLGAALTPISTSLSKDEIETVMERIDVHHLLFERGLAAQEDAIPVLMNCGIGKDFYLRKRTVIGGCSEASRNVNAAFIRFSSGTTGLSKGVVLSHESILERTDAADRGLKVTHQDVILWILSMSFHFVVTILLFLRRGATIVLSGGAFPQSLIKGLTRCQPTFIYASPFHYHLMSESELFTPDMFSGIRLALSTAVKLPEACARSFFDKFHFQLAEAYGIIEVGLPFINTSGDLTKMGSVGKTLPDYEVRIPDPDTKGIGQVWLKGKGMLDAYFSPWRERQSVLQDGWFNTGDLGRLDEDGFLFLVGREKNVINFAGMKVFPDEVEAALNAHPSVLESLVYGVSNPKYGQLPCAKIVLREESAQGFDLGGLRRYCYERLATFEVPKEFEIVSQLPRTASEKIKR